jgi:cytosine/uracil/thiamine/allantoin permease
MISLLLWMSPWAGVVLADFFIARHGKMVAGWSVEDGPVPALQGSIGTKLLSGADLSWLVGIVVAGGLYLALGRRAQPMAVPHAMRGNR